MSHRFCRCGVLWFVLVLGVFLVGCSSGSANVRAGDLSIRSSDGVRESVIELPAEIVDNTEIILDVMLNGTGPYRMLLDTGSAASQVSPEVAQTAGIEASGYLRTVDAHGVSQREPLAVTDLVEIGGLVGRGVPMTIGSLPDLVRQMGSFVGVIGYNIFTSHTLILDYPNGRVFVSNERLESDAIGTVQLLQSNGGGPYIDANFFLPGTEMVLPCEMLLDTGSDASLDLAGGFAGVYGELENKIKKDSSISASGKVMPLEYARLNFDLDFNGIIAQNLMATVYEKKVLGSAIGGDFLRRFKVSIDPVSKLVRFELSDDRTEVEMPVWRIHGFRLGINDDKQVYVTEVFLDSQAEIGGLEVGDVILAFDGTAITTEPSNWPGPTLDGDLVERMYLVERGGQELELVLKFQDLMPVPDLYQSMCEIQEMNIEHDVRK